LLLALNKALLILADYVKVIPRCMFG